MIERGIQDEHGISNWRDWNGIDWNAGGKHTGKDAMDAV